MCNSSNIFFKYKFIILFFILEFIAIYFTFSNQKFVCDGSNFLFGKIYETIYELKKYFLLETENKQLLEENKRLHRESIFSKITKISNDYTKVNEEYLQQYTYTPVQIINNNIHKQENYMIINKGELDGVKVDMGLILPNGIAGIIVKTTPNFSTAISLLNLKIKLNVRLKRDKNFGTLTWDGNDYKYLILYDIPKYSSIKIGDIVETDGKSSTFPEGIPIGRVYSYKLDDGKANFIVKVKIFSDFSTIRNAYLVKNLLKKEWDDLNKDSD
ncbi:rod shape-determining protein MreC [Blattabacterium cuenoti]|uniref:rod shape-determining protein MreC n=1 Tax=Blattabacterium cuenoti TaxID=1653831 RepID=UPI00163B9041|nr:rod shape-determining protein MreC [Blattabacterium cuenoti]